MIGSKIVRTLHVFAEVTIASGIARAMSVESDENPLCCRPIRDFIEQQQLIRVEYRRYVFEILELSELYRIASHQAFDLPKEIAKNPSSFASFIAAVQNFGLGSVLKEIEFSSLEIQQVAKRLGCDQRIVTPRVEGTHLNYFVDRITSIRVADNIAVASLCRASTSLSTFQTSLVPIDEREIHWG